MLESPLNLNPRRALFKSKQEDMCVQATGNDGKGFLDQDIMTPSYWLTHNRFDRHHDYRRDLQD